MFTHPLVRIAEARPSCKHSFKVFVDVGKAIRFAKMHRDSKLSRHQYGSDSRDVRYIVNFKMGR